MPDFPQKEDVQAGFSRLIQELLSENIHRARFEPWEMEILLDIESCNLRGPPKRGILIAYEKAAQRHFDTGARLPLKLSEYLESLKADRKPAAAESPTRKHRSRKG